jgi:hypothetical protein
MTARAQLQKKKTGREPQGVWRQDEVLGDKPPAVKLTLTLDSESRRLVQLLISYR